MDLSIVVDYDQLKVCIVEMACSSQLYFAMFLSYTKMQNSTSVSFIRCTLFDIYFIVLLMNYSGDLKFNPVQLADASVVDDFTPNVSLVV